MTKDQLYEELNYVNATRECRSKYANLVIKDPSLTKPILDILFMVDDKISTRAAWVLEFAFKTNFEILIPHLDYFFSNLSKVHRDSAVRPCAKIVEILIELYYKKENQIIISALNKTHKDTIVEACFDWMIRDEKIAVKAYSMTSLYYLGKEYDWIHDELRIILQRDYNNQSAGFKARAKHVLRKLGVIVPKCKAKKP